MGSMGSTSDLTARLVRAGLRPTRQRMLLAQILFGNGHRHITAEALHREAGNAGVTVSLATVYNTLNQFIGAGLLREVSTEGGRCYFDTNISQHHHFFCEETGELIDIDSDHVSIGPLPEIPAGKQVSSVEVMIKLKSASV